MGILLKFIAKSILEKKLRTFLIIFTVIIATSLFFASTALPDTLEQMVIQNTRKYVGSSDIVVTQGNDALSPFFKWGGLTRGSVDYAITTVDSMALHKGEGFELTTVKLIGIDLNDAKILNPYTLHVGVPKSRLNSTEVIIGKTFSEMHDLSINGTLVLDIYGQEYNLRIAGIADPSGPFMNDGRTVQFLVSPELIRAAYGLSNEYVSTVFVASADDNPESLIASISRTYPELSVKDSISRSELDFQINSIRMPFNIVLGLVFFISFFIIFTSFKLIIKERLPLTGTFRSIGATKKMTSILLVGETLLYGAIGGTSGVLLGIVILKVASLAMFNGVDFNGDFTMYSSINIVIALVVALLITFISSILPIINTSKHSIKEIILNMMEKPKSNKRYRPILGITFIIFAVIAPKITPLDNLLLVVLVAFLLTITAVVFLVPLIANILVKCLERAYEGIFGNIGVLACKNLRNNKNILGSITLLALGITVLLTVNVITYSVLVEVGDLYKVMGGYEVYMSGSSINDEIVTEVKNMKNVTGISTTIDSNHVTVKNSDRTLWQFQGITPHHLDYWRYDVDPPLVEKLNQGNNIILGGTASENYNVKIGDSFTVVVNEVEHTFNVIEIIDSLAHNGDFALISLDKIKEIYDTENYSGLYIKTTDTDGLVRELRENYYYLSPYITTLERQAQENMDGNAQVFDILTGFSALAVVCGILGVINNLLISFIERKRSLAMYRSLGMSKVQILKMVFIESFTGGLAGGIIGVLGGIVLILNIPHITKALVVAIPAHYNLSTFVIALFSGVLVMVLASISPAVKSSKLKIIEAIKYE